MILNAIVAFSVGRFASYFSITPPRSFMKYPARIHLTINDAKQQLQLRNAKQPQILHVIPPEKT